MTAPHVIATHTAVIGSRVVRLSVVSMARGDTRIVTAWGLDQPPSLSRAERQQLKEARDDLMRSFRDALNNGEAPDAG